MVLALRIHLCQIAVQDMLGKGRQLNKEYLDAAINLTACALFARYWQAV
jgi:hypothetical protein